MRLLINPTAVPQPNLRLNSNAKSLNPSGILGVMDSHEFPRDVFNRALIQSSHRFQDLRYACGYRT